MAEVISFDAMRQSFASHAACLSPTSIDILCDLPNMAAAADAVGASLHDVGTLLSGASSDGRVTARYIAEWAAIPVLLQAMHDIGALLAELAREGRS